MRVYILYPYIFYLLGVNFCYKIILLTLVVYYHRNDIYYQADDIFL